MFRKFRTSLLSVVIIAVLVLSAVGPTIVYADGGTTENSSSETSSNQCTTSDGTPTECPTEGGTAEAPVTSGDAATADATVSPEDAAATATPEPSTCDSPDGATADAAASGCSTNGDAGTGDPSAASVDAAAAASTEVVAPADPASASTDAAAPVDAAPATDTAVLTDVPENTTVTVLNADGEVQPLATQAAADAIAQSDPIWCPEGQAPTPGANGCTQSFSSFSALLNYMSGNSAYQGAGTIYVQQGNYQGGESSIDLNSGSYDLSNISGYDLTITGGWNTSNNTVDATTTSNFTVPIFIGTSSNPWGGSLTINNISINQPNGNGLTLYSQGDINLTNVSVTNSPNGSGAELDAGGDVTIEDSNFVRNKVSAATIRAKGSVAISNSNFSNRPDGTQRLQIKGLDITSDGAVSLFNVMAINNREVGANINAGGRVTIVQSIFSGTKTIKNGEFLGYGLQITTPDIIDLDTVTADDNFLWGASLNAGGDVNIANSNFNANTTESPGYIDDTGLLVTSGGNVSLQNVHADDNRLIGAKIDATGDVSINNSSFSNNNGVTDAADGSPLYHGYGLQVTTTGNIFINQVTASNNTLFGAHLEAGSDVTISASDFSNQTSDSDTETIGRGLEVISGGNIFMDNVTLNNNQTFGANLQAGADIFLDTVTATGNGTDGVALQAACVHLIGGTFSGNGQYGLNLGSSSLDLVSAPVFGSNGQGDIFPLAPVSCAPGIGTDGVDTGGGDTGGNGGVDTGGGDTGGSGGVDTGGSGTGGGVDTGSGGGIDISLNPAGTDTSVPATGDEDVSVKLVSNASTSEEVRDGGINLNTYLAYTRSGSSYGIFIGKYAYVHTRAGLQIFALEPDAQYLAMAAGSQ